MCSNLPKAAQQAVAEQFIAMELDNGEFGLLKYN